MHVVIPVLENYSCIGISSKTYPLLHDEFITKDNVKVKVETTFTFNVFDAKKAVLNVENYLLALFHLVEITMRSAISSINYEELLYRKERTGNIVLEIVRTACDEWGIKVEKIEIKEITKE